MGCGRSGASPSGDVAQHADHRPQVLQRLMGGGPDHAGRACDLLRRRVGPELQRARVQRQQRDPVREHVVHLARDPRPLGLPGLLHAQLLLRLSPLGAITQRDHELAPGADEHAPDEDAGDDHDRQQQLNDVRRVVAREDRQVDRLSGDRDRRGDHRLPKRPVHGAREQRHHGGAARGGRERADDRERDRDAERPPPPHPHRREPRGPAEQVERDEPFGKLAYWCVEPYTISPISSALRNASQSTIQSRVERFPRPCSGTSTEGSRRGCSSSASIVRKRRPANARATATKVGTGIDLGRYAFAHRPIDGAHDRADPRRMIAVDHLTKRYGSQLAVDDISFVCEPGTVTGFLGPTAPGSPQRCG